MAYYYCENCKELFPDYDVECKTEEDVHWWLDDKPSQTFYFYYCPYCHSEDIAEAPTCEECGDWFLPDELDDDGLCANCREELNRLAAEYLKDERRESEKDA